MEAYAIHKSAMIAPRKARMTMDLVRGKDVATARNILENYGYDIIDYQENNDFFCDICSVFDYDKLDAYDVLLNDRFDYYYDNVVGFVVGVEMVYSYSFFVEALLGFVVDMEDIVVAVEDILVEIDMVDFDYFEYFDYILVEMALLVLEY